MYVEKTNRQRNEEADRRAQIGRQTNRQRNEEADRRAQIGRQTQKANTMEIEVDKIVYVIGRDKKKREGEKNRAREKERKESD